METREKALKGPSVDKYLAWHICDIKVCGQNLDVLHAWYRVGLADSCRTASKSFKPLHMLKSGLEALYLVYNSAGTSTLIVPRQGPGLRYAVRWLSETPLGMTVWHQTHQPQSRTRR
eukprot:scaffold4735_cov403-Prasinococcus_capsulatus_cf.AAC.10